MMRYLILKMYTSRWWKYDFLLFSLLWYWIFANSSIAFKPAGVAAQPKPKTFAIIFVIMCGLALWLHGKLGNNQFISGLIAFSHF